MTDDIPDFRKGWYSNPQFEGSEDHGPDHDTESLARLGRANKGTEQKTVRCPRCHEEFGNLPNHLRHCDGADGSEVDA